MLRIEEKIGQLLMAGFEGLEPPDYILEWLSEGRLGGVILFRRNVENPQQVARLTQMCREAAKFPILISIDQEGGVVARLREQFTESPGAMALSATGSTELAGKMSEVMGIELQALGINWNLAPVVDVTHDTRNASVGTRSLGTDKARVSQFAVAEVEGFQRGGVAACAKHFPGLGNTPVDTHDALAVISGSVDYLWENDLVPFRAVVEAGIGSVMVSHVKFEALDADYPSTLSPVIVQKLLREELSFQGVAATDSMEMKAILDQYQPGESTVLAVLAGLDAIFFSHEREHQEAAYDALLEAVKNGRISEARLDESVERLKVMKERFPIGENRPASEVILSPEHVAIADEAARRGTVLLKKDSNFFPIQPYQHKIGVVEFTSWMESGIVEEGGITGFIKTLRKHLPDFESVSLRGKETDEERLNLARKVVDSVDVVILATRNAHLVDEQRDFAQKIIDNAKQVILLCLRNPYDVNVLKGAGTIMCSCGDSVPSVQAAVDALLGEFDPTGQLPVPVEVV